MNKALAEIDEDFNTEYKNKIKTLLSIKKQEGWPDNVTWPEE